MLLIPCPWCGERVEAEFRYGGEAHLKRPDNHLLCSDETWAEYLFMRRNPKGWHRERWMHLAGCKRWFYVVRHTQTHRIAAAYKVGEAWPALPA
ncbi:MAG: sarcosine oxidase subunit delta family protein [Alphaproteobacteria bacterium]|nr:sarcosine oxidase subunit delta family protein [Alphaproteobacteria bacterium]